MPSSEEWRILATSFAIAARALMVALPLAIACAYALSRAPFFGKSVLDGLVHLPLLLPPVLVGFLLLLLFGRSGPLGGLRLAFSANAAALATAVMTFPLLVRAIRLAFEAADPRLSEAAAVLGAGPGDRFWSIALPLAGPGVLAGAVTAFAAGLGEFGAVITFAGDIPGETRTLPLAIYAAMQQPGGEALALRLGGFSFALALVGLAAGEALLGWSRRRQAA